MMTAINPDKELRVLMWREYGLSEPSFFNLLSRSVRVFTFLKGQLHKLRLRVLSVT